MNTHVKPGGALGLRLVAADGQAHVWEQDAGPRAKP